MTRLAALALALLPAAAAAQDATPLTYEIFEQGVPHIDLAVCPTELAGPGLFCRATVVNDQINVFVFSEEGDQPLVAFRAWSADLLTGLMD